MKRTKNIKRWISIILIICLLLVENTVTMASERHFSISDELLEALRLSREEFENHEFSESNEVWSCVLWTKDIDMEPAVIYGIDEAEKTRKDPTDNYYYPYEIYYNEDGVKDIVVNLSDDENDEYVQTYIMAKREKANELYADNNQDFIDKVLSEYLDSITYVSQFSPCVFARLCIQDIFDLCQQEDVYYLGYQDTNIGENDSLTSVQADDLPDILDAIRANDSTRSAYHVTGANVCIGQFDEYCPEHGDHDPDRDRFDGSGHADAVWELMSAVAPGVSHICSCTHLTDGSMASNSEEGIEWILSNGANILNISMGWTNRSEYTDFSRWIDHIAYNHDIHVVKSAGNKNTENGANGITSPGMAYNIITVGNVNMASPFNINTKSSRNTYGPNRTSRRTFKPDLCAPGTFSDNSYGTSYAAPLVSGTIALLCQYRPLLKTKQHIVKAILCATVKASNHRYTNCTVTEYYKKYGAGIVDARAALNAVEKNRCAGTGTVSNSSPIATYSMNITSGTTKRVVLAYANRILLNNPVNTHWEQTAPASGGHIGELKLEIYAPDGSFVKKNDTEGANVKVLRFNPADYGYGTYTIKVIQTISADNPTRQTNFGLSWR